MVSLDLNTDSINWLFSLDFFSLILLPLSSPLFTLTLYMLLRRIWLFYLHNLQIKISSKLHNYILKSSGMFSLFSIVKKTRCYISLVRFSGIKCFLFEVSRLKQFDKTLKSVSVCLHTHQHRLISISSQMLGFLDVL